MRCPDCGHNNRLGARFCVRCGASLEQSATGDALAPNCPVCGTPVRTGASFCPRCGAVLQTTVRSDTLSPRPTHVAPAQVSSVSPTSETVAV